MIYLFYTTYISVDLAHHELFHAKVGKDGINVVIPWRVSLYVEIIYEVYWIDCL